MRESTLKARSRPVHHLGNLRQGRVVKLASLALERPALCDDVATDNLVLSVNPVNGAGRGQGFPLRLDGHFVAHWSSPFKIKRASSGPRISHSVNKSSIPLSSSSGGKTLQTNNTASLWRARRKEAVDGARETPAGQHTPSTGARAFANF